MMTNNFNYGPRINFEKLHQHLPHSTIIPSEYLEPISASESKSTRPSESLASGTSTLGSHWKRVDSSVKSDNTTAPPSSFSTYSDGTVVPSVYSVRSFDYPPLSESSVSLNTVSQVTTSTESSAASALSVGTRDFRKCINLQMLGLDELDSTLDRASEQFSDSFWKESTDYDQAVKKGEILWQKFEELIECLNEKSGDCTDEELPAQGEKFLDYGTILKTFRTKYRIEKFVRNTESVYITNNNTLEMILDNEKSVQKIRKNLSIIRKMEAYFLTVSENKDNRVKEFFRGIVNMVPTLPLNQNERADIDHVIRNIEEDSKFENKYKCELIMRHLLATISNWDKETHGTNSNLGSSIWKSIPSEMHTASQNSYVSEVIESSSFELANLSTDDSNLADLEGELRSASIRRAVEGPKGIYEFGPWDTASIFSQFSNNSDGHTSIQSLQDHHSSYELSSSDDHSILPSLSSRSVPNKIFENTVKEIVQDDLDLKTALSIGEPIVAGLPRTPIDNETEVVRSCTQSDSADTFNFSSVSLNEMVDDALHTAKGVESASATNTSATNLLDALHSSALKCGVAFNDLMTAISSSSESVSDTQASHHSSASH
ncbi:Protein kinase domain-containing protein [Caenorhabditis elegans]|uniref:Protein kinase domain-containing protein n=1 Tax=Caenorhabditis elegans TaxID=6239 RepID=A0A061ACG0_CAEEL|nr:Protein kinase domain-containing protein [Caenorhabditis elegans]CDR32637.1 Protein kinase domain-containing protein [Caenorhabditis elegans]|eukprot:NP_001293882.1 Uncharacterized protein CELE_T25B9.6 [Caenorhabditis elegans]